MLESGISQLAFTFKKEVVCENSQGQAKNKTKDYTLDAYFLDVIHFFHFSSANLFSTIISGLTGRCKHLFPIPEVAKGKGCIQFEFPIHRIPIKNLPQ